MKRFWNWIRDADGGRILRLEGPIDEDSFWGDEATPREFREELEADEGDVTVYINSPGGNVFAAAEIYTMLLEHKGKITVKIDAIAASAASVVAMAGEQVLMSPVAMLMIHDPMTIAMGNTKDMEKAIDTLNEVKESIINAYHIKSGLNRKKISQMMQDETWMNARKAVELGFADDIIGRDTVESEEAEDEKDGGNEIEAVWQPYSTKIMGQTILNRLGCTAEVNAQAETEPAADTTENVEPTETGVSEQMNMFEEALPEAEVPAEQEIPDGETEAAEEREAEGEPESEAETKVSEAETKDSEGETQEAPTETKDSAVEADDAVPETKGTLVEGTEPETQEMETSEAEAPMADKTTDKAKPMIGMDGKTEDGAMPYNLLMKQLECLK